METNQATWWTTERVALIAITLVGMAVCTAGVGKVATSGRWLSVPGIAGSVLGVLVLGIVTARLLGRPVPLVESDRAAIVAVLVVAAVKVAIAAAFRVPAWA